jgi:NADP-dependent 3-hydroxy acid dehydrogenase YdfG
LSDVGRATAKLLIASGALVALADIHIIALSELAEELGPNAIWKMVDVRSRKKVEKWIREIPAVWGVNYLDGM